MDTARKFIQMGRTRSLRYALRAGGRKYKTSEQDGKGKRKVEIPRTGNVYDQGKLRGAQVFEDYLRRVWEDEIYIDHWQRWRREQGSTVAIPKIARKAESAGMSGSQARKREKSESEEITGKRLGEA